MTYQKSVSRTQILSHTLDLKIHNHTLTKNFSQLRLNFDLNCKLKTQLRLWLFSISKYEDSL